MKKLIYKLNTCVCKEDAPRVAVKLSILGRVFVKASTRLEGEPTRGTLATIKSTATRVAL